MHIWSDPWLSLIEENKQNTQPWDKIKQGCDWNGKQTNKKWGTADAEFHLWKS